MDIKKTEQLFFDCKIDSKLRDALSNAKQGDRRYFEDPKGEFLRVCNHGDDRWIGKVSKSGIGANDVEDIQRNVVSILRRVAPEVRISPSSIKIFSVVEEAETTTAAPAPDSSGPYIDYKPS